MEELLTRIVDIARGVWHRRWAALLTAWVVGIVGLLVALRMPQNYEASVRVFVDTQTVLKPLLAGLAVRQDEAQQVNALSRTLITRATVQKVIEATRYVAPGTTSTDRVVDDVARRLNVASAGRDNLYTLSFRDAEPDQAKRVVAALLNEFVQSSVGDKRADAEQARHFIEEQIKTYEEKLQEAEDRVKQFKLRHLGVLGTDGKDYYNKMATLSQQRSEARQDLRSAEEARDAIKRELSGEDPVFLPESGGSAQGSAADATQESGVIPEMDARIDALRKNLDELLRRFTEQHPDVIGTRRVLAQLEEQRSREIERRKKAAAAAAASGKKVGAIGPVERNPVYQRLKVSLVDAEAQVASARARAEDIESQYQQLNAAARMVPQVEAEFVQLNRDYDVQKKNYEALVARRETAVISGNMEEAGASIFRVVDPPRVSQYPVAPNRPMVIGAVLAAALVAGVLVSFCWSQIQPIFHDARTLRQLTSRPFLGSISMLPSHAAMRRRKLKNYAFAVGSAVLIIGLGAAVAITAASSRIA